MLAHQGGWDEILLVVTPVVVFFGLLLVRDRNRAARDTFAKVAGQPLVESGVVAGDRHQPLLQQIVDISARNVERDEFATLFNAGSGTVGARRLAADFRGAFAKVEQQLIGDG